jgi:hypothetical protein
VRSRKLDIEDGSRWGMLFGGAWKLGFMRVVNLNSTGLNLRLGELDDE